MKLDKLLNRVEQLQEPSTAWIYEFAKKLIIKYVHHKKEPEDSLVTKIQLNLFLKNIKIY